MSLVDAKSGRLARTEILSVFGLGVLLLGGCTLIPKDGPTGAGVWGQAEVQVADNAHLSYAIVKLSPLVIAKIGTDPDQPLGFSRLARFTPSASVRVGPSDKLSVTIFEAAAGGLFIPDQAGARSGNFVQLPSQEVDRNGNITVPYAGGAVRVIGRTLREIQLEIERRLDASAIRPQVMVTMDLRLSSAVSVQGEVYTPNQIALPPGGMKLLTALARSGGSRNPNYESVVTLQRHNRVERALLSTIVKNPRENIELAPGDDVYVAREQRAFLVMGATPSPGAIGGQNNRRIPFEADSITLAEGIAKAGGLDSTRSDPRAVFLIRLVPRESLRRIGVDISAYPQAVIPTVFTVDLKDAEGFFIANNFFMRHRDIIFVSDAPSVDLTKFLLVINAITSTARDAVGLTSDIRSFIRGK